MNDMFLYRLGQKRGGGSSGGGKSYEWVNLFTDGTTLSGETFTMSENARSKPVTGEITTGEQYKMTVDGIEFILSESDGVWMNEECPFTLELSEAGILLTKNGFSGRFSGTLKLESKVAIESSSGGVGVAPMIDHGYGSATFVLGSDVTIPAGGSVTRVEVDTSTLGGANTPGGFGYIYGHPEITARRGYASKYGQYLVSVWNSSATDFTFKAGETYTLVYLYNAE